MPKHKFKVKLIGQDGSQVAALKPPFDVVEVFQRKGRVPVKGTINGFPFRSSLMNMGDGHMMVVNAQLRAGAKCKAGDTVDVTMELDEGERKVEVPAYLKEIINSDAKAKQFWSKLSFTHKKEYVREIDGAKRPETKEKRIAAMMDALTQRPAQEVSGIASSYSFVFSRRNRNLLVSSTSDRASPTVLFRRLSSKSSATLGSRSLASATQRSQANPVRITNSTCCNACGDAISRSLSVWRIAIDTRSPARLNAFSSDPE